MDDRGGFAGNARVKVEEEEERGGLWARGVYVQPEREATLQIAPLLYNPEIGSWSAHSEMYIRPRRALWRTWTAALSSVLVVASAFAIISTFFPESERVQRPADLGSRNEASMLLWKYSDEGWVELGQPVPAREEQSQALMHIARMGGEWGLVNPETGASRLQCGDSVAGGR